MDDDDDDDDGDVFSTGTSDEVFDVDSISETPFDVVVGKGDRVSGWEDGEVVEDGDVGVTTAFAFLSSMADADADIDGGGDDDDDDMVLELSCEIEAEDVVGERLGDVEAEMEIESKAEVLEFVLETKLVDRVGGEDGMSVFVGAGREKEEDPVPMGRCADGG